MTWLGLGANTLFGLRLIGAVSLLVGFGHLPSGCFLGAPIIIFGAPT